MSGRRDSMGEGGVGPGRAPAAGRLPAPTTQKMLDAMLAFSHEASVASDKQELCGLFMRIVCGLLPGRRLCLRVVDGHSLELTELFAEGDLRSGAATAPLVFRPSAMRRMRVHQRVRESPRVRVQDEYEPVLVGSVTGFAVPLAAGGKLYGSLNVEYETGDPPAKADEEVLLPFCNQLSLVLRHVGILQRTRRQRASLNRLVDQTGILFFSIDGNGRVTAFNEALARLCGVQSREMIGVDLEQWLVGQGADRLAETVAMARRGHETLRASVRLPGPAGATPRAIFDTVALRSPSGEVESVVGVGEDSTALETLQRQVIEAEKLASVGQLAAGVVHELNNPLTSIVVYADYLAKKLAREGRDAADVAKLHRILEAAERILRVSRDLVAYARPTSDQYDLLSINEVVEQALSFCEHVMKKEKARVVRELADDLPPIYGIRGQLQQVLVNLLTNASHAMKEGGGTICVRTSDGGGCVVVEVIDDGQGIGPADQPHIFEPFFTTKKDGKGAGLGLSIVKGIVEKHRGDVQCSSSVGVGTTFRIVLPCGQRPTAKE